MKIENSKYYVSITAPLRATELKSNIEWGEDGFAYKSLRLAFIMKRISKNRFKITAQNGLKEEIYMFENEIDTVAWAVDVIRMDRLRTVV